MNGNRCILEHAPFAIHEVMPFVQPPLPACAMFVGPWSFPRSRTLYHGKRPHTSMNHFLDDPGGGEGVAKLLRARDMANEEWGYEWTHTVLVVKGRSVPTLPLIVVSVWTIAVTLICMLLLRFDILLLQKYGGDVEDVATWKKSAFQYCLGLQVCTSSMCCSLPVLLKSLDRCIHRLGRPMYKFCTGLLIDDNLCYCNDVAISADTGGNNGNSSDILARVPCQYWL